MKQCRWEADGSSLLRGQQKGLRPFGPSQDSPSPCCLVVGIVRCVPQNTAVWQAGHCTTPKGWGRLRALLKSHQSGLFASQSSLWALSNPFLSFSLPFTVLQKTSLYSSIISPFPWDVCESCLNTSSPLWVHFPPDANQTVSTPVHGHRCVSSCTKIQAALLPNFYLAMQTMIKLWCFSYMWECLFFSGFGQLDHGKLWQRYQKICHFGRPSELS